MPPQITYASAILVKRRNTKIAFSLKCCISALPEFNQLFDFFNLFDSRLILTLLYDSLSHIINAFSPQIQIAEMGDRLATTGMGRKWGGAAVGAGSPLGPHLTQCGLGQGLPLYQVAP